MKSISLLLFVFLLLTGCENTSDSHQKDDLPHILIIGIDGLGAHGVKMAKDIPNLNYLMQNGVSSLEVKTILPSVSGPAWTTIFTGTTPERHGVGGNDGSKEARNPVFMNDEKYHTFPTIFGEIRKNLPQAVIGAFYHWGTTGDFIEEGVCDVSLKGEDEINTTNLACQFIKEKQPNLTFVQLDHQDGVGHGYGYRSSEYIQSVERTDSIIGIYLNTLKEAGLYDETIIFIVSDHGGINKGHGGNHPDEMTVPLVIYGENIKKGYQIEKPTFNYDIAPTVLSFFGLTPNEWVVGKPIREAFADNRE